MRRISAGSPGARLLCALGLVLGIATAGAARVAAHAMPERASPPVGATLERAPDAVRIVFDEDLGRHGCQLRVEDAHRRVVSRGPAHVDPTHPRVLTVGLEPLGPGVYHVRWVAVSPDGHRTEGNYIFTVSPP